MDNNIENLINDVKQIIETDKNEAKKTGSKFNIFNIIGIATREVYMCRVLAELLDPQGCHCQDTKYLNLFIELLAKKSKKNYLKKIIGKNVTIRKEDPTKYVENHENRRIDIVINEKDGYYIPIEVKINADEQENQCSDYLRQAANYYKVRNLKENPFVCFLTKSGYPPKSIKENEESQIICISWKKDITKWLEECIKETPEQAISIKGLLTQFKISIEQFSNNVGDKTMLNITELLKNKNNFEAAITIREGVESLSETIWKDLTDKIYNNIKNDIPKEHIDNSDLTWKIKCFSNNHKNEEISFHAGYYSNKRSGFYKKEINCDGDVIKSEEYSLAEAAENIDECAKQISGEIIDWYNSHK